MERLAMCRICLAEDVRMHAVTSRPLQEIYEKLTDIPFITEDSRPVLACFFCYAKLKQCSQFHRKCLESEDVFAQILNEDYERKPKSFSGGVELFGGFIKTSIEHISVGYDEGEDSKEPSSIENTHSFDLKQDFRIQEAKSTFPHSEDTIKQEPSDSYPLEDVLTRSDTDSDDNIPLMKFKTELEDDMPKKRRIKKVKVKPDCREIILNKEQQRTELEARALSANYTHSPYRCDMCYKGFVDDRAYSNHMSKHDKSSGSHECDICHRYFRSVQILRTHAYTTHVRIFKCNKCGHVSHTGSQAEIHDKWHSGHTYECRLCSHTFKKPTSYYSHMRQRHPTENVCNICGETFVGKHGLKMHKSKTHNNGEKMNDPDDPRDPAPGRFCSECNIQFYNLEAWERHILSSVRHILKTEDNNTECKICSWRYEGHATLATHMKEHAKVLRSRRQTKGAEKHLRCQQCGGSFMSRSKLQAHVNRTHLGLKYNRNVVCEVCGKKCTSNATLRYHQRTHSGEKPYSCSTCNKHFADSNQLRIHTRVHTGEKPYVCAECGKRFSQKPALNRHYRVHTGAKPYTCQYCSRTFSQSNSLKLHVKTVHLKQPTNSRKNKTQNTTQLTKTEKICDEMQTTQNIT